MLKSLNTQNGIIEYELKATKSHKIIVKIAKDGKIICSCPQGIAVCVAEDFIKSRSKWIVQTSNKLKEQYQSLQSSELNQIFVFGKSYPVVRVESQKTDVLFEDGKIYLCGDEQKSQNILKTKLVGFAKQYLAQRAYELQKQIGEKSAVVVEVKKVRSWWGCYSVKNKKIKFSVRLIAREKSSIDSVIFHEFAHIKVQNHQKAFYKILLSYCPDYYSFKKALSDSKYALTDKFILDK